MIKTIPFQNTTIRFEQKGEGETIVLLHGYLEALDTWDTFADKLTENYQVIAIDLLGHGKSGTVSEISSMELMANAVFEVIAHLKLTDIHLVGHSMGGYVSLAFLEKYSEKLKSLCLFHSSPLADNEVKKVARNEAIQKIKSGQKIALCKAHVPKTFAKDNEQKFVKEIGFGKIIAMNTSDEGIIAALAGMRDRKNYASLLKNSKIPFLYILGKKDNFIPNNILKHFDMPEDSTVGLLDNSGHQGYIEEPEKSFKILNDFWAKI